MARRRPRYEVIGRMSSNGVDLRGQRLVLMGECTWTGATKTKDGKKPYARELDSYRFRFEDQKWARTSGAIKGEIVIAKKHMTTFVKEVNDE